MNRYITAVVCLLLSGCGSNSSFNWAGIWDGQLPLYNNDCPFDLPADQSQLFPVQINQISDENLDVRAADGSSGNGVVDEFNQSFVVTSNSFGKALSNTGTYRNCIITYTFGYYSPDGNTAQGQFGINLLNCIDNVDGKTKSCAGSYFGEVVRR